MAGSPPSLIHSFKIQGRVIWALTLREVITRYGRHNIGFMWMFAEPMIFTLGVTVLWTALKSVHGSDLPIAAFALTGYSTVLLWRNMPGRLIDAVEPNLSLLYHRNVRIIDIFLSRLLLEGAGATMSFMILGAVLVAIGMIQPPENIPLLAAGWMLTAWFGCALALLVGALGIDSELVHKIWHPLSYLIFPLSGAAFMLSAVPSGARELLALVPMVNGTEMIRDGFFGSQVRTFYDANYLALCNLVLTFFGLLVLRLRAPRVVPQ